MESAQVSKRGGRVSRSLNRINRICDIEGGFNAGSNDRAWAYGDEYGEASS